MDIDEMIAVLQAARDGKVIQVENTKQWDDCEEPIWDFYRATYRVKPEPVVLGLQVAITKYGEFIFTPQNPNLELEFIDGVLVGAKVL